MGVDVDQVLAQTENAPNSEPMHGKTGEIRRNPSTDQKKARRRLEEARLLRTAAVAETLADQRAAITELEALRTEAMLEEEEARALDLTAARINDVLVPGHVHEMHTAATDWLLELPETTASQAEAEHALIAEATLWYGRVDPVIKADGEEFIEQACNKARYVASQYGEHAEPAAAAFVIEAVRLLDLESEPGLRATAGLIKEAIQSHDPFGEGFSRDQPESEPPQHSRHPLQRGLEKLPGAIFNRLPSSTRERVQTEQMNQARERFNRENPDWDKFGPKAEPPRVEPGLPHHPDDVVDLEAPGMPVRNMPPGGGGGGGGAGGGDGEGKVVQKAHEWEGPKARLPHFVREIGRNMAHGHDVSGLDAATNRVTQQFYSSYAEHLATRSAALSREPDRFPHDAEGTIEDLFGDDPYDDYSRDYADESHRKTAKPKGPENYSQGDSPCCGAAGHRPDDSGPFHCMDCGKTFEDKSEAEANRKQSSLHTAQGPLIPAEAEALGGGEGGGLMSGLSGMGGGGGGGGGQMAKDLGSGLDTSGLDADTANVSHNFYNAVAGPQIPAPQGNSGPPSPPLYEPDTDSTRAPALQEMADYSGFSGSSVVPDSSGQSQAMNGQANTNDDHANPPSGFPVSGSHTPKESSVTDHAQCPTCGGLGRVAVRKMAYSGLPQVDQIVNADETKGETPLPTDVAFPLVGWDPSNVQRAIQETEKIMPSNNQPHVSAQQHQAQGRDNSGWLGDDGAKGLDYPGYSAPVGYDGSSNLGQPDPVYGFGGDQPQAGPKKPYGFEEANDFTNNPGQPYDPTTPHNNDSGAQESGPAMNTQGGGMGQATGSLDPFIAAAEEEIARQQELIRLRNSMLAPQ